MEQRSDDAQGLKVIILASVGRSAALIAEALRSASIPSEVVSDSAALAGAMSESCGACVVLEEDLATSAAVGTVAERLRVQPAWSELQLLIFARDPERFGSWVKQTGSLRGVTMMERPIRKSTLVSLVQAALRSRRLQYQLRDAFRELEETNRALRQRNEDLDRFGRTLAHDVRGPLATVQGGLTLMKLLVEAGRTKDLREPITRCARAASSISQLTEELLAYARAGQRHLIMGELSPVDSGRILSELREELAHSIGERRASIVTSELPIVQANSVLLKQVLQNLVMNAIKYNDSELPRVEVRAEAVGRQWRFEVRDNGRGIPQGSGQRLFEPFYRSGEGSGHGLGLATCQLIVEGHGGHIHAQRNPEGGSTFTFTLPRSS